MNQNELLGLRLLSLHNLRFVVRLTDGAREAIERGEFAAYKRDQRNGNERTPDHHHPVRRRVAAAALPARRRRAQHEAMQDSVEAGDEIITAGGLHGTVKEIDDETARVEIAPDVVVTLDRRAIAAVATRDRGRAGGGRARGSRPWNRPGTPLTYRERVVPALEPDPCRPDRPRPRRRGAADRPELAVPPRREEGPRPPGRPRGRPEGGAAEGPQARRRPTSTARSTSCGTASTSSASPRRRSASRAPDQIVIQLAGVHDPEQAAKIDRHRRRSSSSTT